MCFQSQLSQQLSVLGGIIALIRLTGIMSLLQSNVSGKTVPPSEAEHQPRQERSGTWMEAWAGVLPTRLHCLLFTLKEAEGVEHPSATEGKD